MKVRDYEEQRSEYQRDMFIRDYINSIKLLAEKINKELGFYPVVIGRLLI